MSVTANPPVQASRRVINIFVINGALESGRVANETAAIATVPRTNSPNELDRTNWTERTASIEQP